MIIDAHVHVHPEVHGLGERHDASAETFLRALDTSPLDIAVLLPIEPFITTDFVFEVAARRPGRIACFASVDFRRGLPCVEELEDIADTRPIRGLKLHPRRQNLSEKDWPVVKALVSKATDLGLPVLIDSFPYGKGVLTDDTLELIASLSDALPKARLIIAHMGGLRILEALILARASYNIYFDTSLILSTYRGSHIEQDIFYAIHRLGAERCLHGSDYPDVGLTKAYEDMREAFEQRGFTDEQQEWVFGKTAAHLLRLTKGELP